MTSKTEIQNKKTYDAPIIKVNEIEIEQNILAGGSGTGAGDIPDMGPENW